MTLNSDPPHLKKNRLLSVFSGLRNRSKSRKPSTKAPTQDNFVSPPAPDERSVPVHDGQLQETDRHHSQSPSFHPSPTAHVEDCRSIHHHGGNYYNSHSVRGTANYIGSVTNSTLGTNSVTTIERAFFVSGNEAALLWDSLPKQRDLSGQQSEYLEGSREETVQYAMAWGEDPKSELALFIYGAAGVGKSTFARHLTHRLHAAGRLAASVSLSGIPTDARGPESVVKLIAREIGEKHPEAIPAILAATRLCKGAPLEDHWERFLKDVVCSLKHPYPLTVLFDAIDEWESYSSLIRALPRLSSSASSLRFILLGRLDPRARGFNDAPIHPYPLHPVSKGTMERYFGHQFDSVCWDSGLRPSLTQRTQLAELANGLFIWASIVCSLLKERLSLSSPNETLEAILHLRRGLGENDGLARLYHQALVWLFPDKDSHELVRKYLGTTLVLQEPLPIADFSLLTDLPARATEEIRGRLTAFQIRQPTEHDGRRLVHPAGDLFHLSLLEYLQSTSTPGDAAFHISTFSAHSHLAELCLTKFPQFPPASRSISTLHLTCREKYIVKYLATHIYKGTPSVKPGSSTSEWSQTRHQHILQQLGIAHFHHWGSLLLDLVKPGSVIREGEYANYSAGGLILDIAAVLGSDSSVRSFQISCLEVAVRLLPEVAKAWLDLGWAYCQSADYSKDIDAGERAVLAHQNALYIAEEFRSLDRASALFSVATSLHTRFQLTGNTQDLDRSISLHRDALALRPPGHADRAYSLNNLAISLASSSELGDPINDIDEIIHLQREVLELCPPGHADRVTALQNLAAFIESRSRKMASTADLDEAVRLSREALELRPSGHADSVASLRSLTSSLHFRFETTTSVADIEESISLGREALENCPLGHTHRATSLNCLAWELTLRYQARGLMQDLEESIFLGRESLSLLPIGHPDRLDTLDTLAKALHFKPEHLDEALHLSRESVSLIPPGNRQGWDIRMTLATILLRHHESSGSVEELQEATSVCEEALSECPPNHYLRPRLLDLQAILAEAKFCPPPQP